MSKPFKLILSVLCAAIVLSVMSVISFAASVNGISVSASELKPGDTFTVTINVPSAASADTAAVKAEFDSSAFDVVSWNPVITNGLYNSGSGFFVLTSANAARVIDLSGGLTFSATLSVRSTAAGGSYPIKLVSHSFSYVKDNGYDCVELWEPTVKEVYVKIAVATTQTTTSATTTKATTTTQKTTTSVSSAATTSVKQSGTSKSTFDEPEDTYTIPADEIAAANDDDEDENIETTRIVDDSGSSGGGKKDAEITYKASLGGLPEGTIRISVHNAIFDRNTEIRIIETADAGDFALKALKNMGLGNHDFYAFDISLYDTVTNKRIQSLTSGYVEFSVPVPKKLIASGQDLNLYHIVNGSAELLSSSVVSEDGIYRIKFRANSFSPYAIVDMVGELAEPVQTGASGNGSDAGVRPLNPHTGITMAIAIPAALVGCAVLSRKIIKKRKRKKNYME